MRLRVLRRCEREKVMIALRLDATRKRGRELLGGLNYPFSPSL
jgi:hypothetical protein